MDKLRIVSWNCGGRAYNGFNSEKAHELFKLLEGPAPDILVVQEITIKECLAAKSPQWRYAVWYNDGLDDSYRGIAVFSQRCNIGFTEKFNRTFRYVLPYKIADHNPDFELFAVWTKANPINYEKNLFEALNYYKPFDRNTIVIGDYNVGACDAHTERFEELKEKMDAVGLVNCARGTEQGKPTSVWRKDRYQNDYCFASGNLAENAALKVMDDDTVRKLSDHYPIIVDFDF